MSEQKVIGRVSIVPKGEWSSSNNYTRLDLVKYNGGSYLAKIDNINVPVTNSNTWLQIASKGDIGDPADPETVRQWLEDNIEPIVSILNIPDYSTAQSYSPGDVVFYTTNSKIYRCHTATTAGTLPTDTNYWIEVVAASIIDDSLTISGAAADAKATGDAVDDLKSALDSLFGLSEISVTWEIGFISNTGDETSSPVWIRTTEPISFNADTAVVLFNQAVYDALSTRIRFAVVMYNDENTFLGKSSAIYGISKVSDIVANYNYTGVTKFRLVAQFKTQTSISDDRFSLLTQNIKVFDSTRSLLSDIFNLQDDAAALKTDVNELQDAAQKAVDKDAIGTRVDLSGIHAGDVDADGQAIARSDNKRLITDLLSCTDGLYLIDNTLNFNLAYFVCWYDATGALIGKSPLAWKTSSHINALTYADMSPAFYRLILHKTTNTAFSLADIQHVADNCYILITADTLISPLLAKDKDGDSFLMSLIKANADDDGSYRSSFNVNIPFDGSYSNQIYTLVAKYEMDTGAVGFPHFRFGYDTIGVQHTMMYTLGGKDGWKTKQVRVLRPYGESRDLILQIIIPEGCTVYIKAANGSSDNHIDRNAGAIRFDGHVRIPTMPNSSLASMEMAAMAGFEAFIDIPKRLSDGVWVFYHDDSLVYNNTFIRQADGSTLPSSYNGTLWSSISSEEAFSWDWGISFGDAYAGIKPKTMQEAFELCAKTGMKPMFSLHPMPTVSELEEIKDLAKKYNVLHMLGFVCNATYMPRVWSVFGSDIDTYLVIVSAGKRSIDDINAAISSLDAMTGCTARRVVELFASTVYNAYFGDSPYDPYRAIKDAGYISALCCQNGATKPVSGSTGVYEWAADVEYWFKEHGVTEFNEEIGYNRGLLW